jgi:hypothetical protein
MLADDVRTGRHVPTPEDEAELRWVSAYDQAHPVGGVRASGMSPYEQHRLEQRLAAIEDHDEYHRRRLWAEQERGA